MVWGMYCSSLLKIKLLTMNASMDFEKGLAAERAPLKLSFLNFQNSLAPVES